MYCWFFVHAGITCIFTKDFPEMLIAPFQIFTKISFGHHFVSISYFDLTIVMHAYYILASKDLWDSFLCFFFLFIKLWMQCSVNLFTTIYVNTWINLLLTFKFWFDHYLHVCIRFIIYAVDFLWLQIKFNTFYDQTLYSLWNPFVT